MVVDPFGSLTEPVKTTTPIKILTNTMLLSLSKTLLLAFVAFAGSSPALAATNDDLHSLLQTHCSSVQGRSGSWDCMFDDLPLMVLSDVSHNRMRIMTEVGPVVEAEVVTLLQANFDRALDARYAVRGNSVYAVYLHPLAELTAGQVLVALRQVTNLAKTYGTTYSSGNLSFVGRNHPAHAVEKKIKTNTAEAVERKAEETTDH